MVSARIATSDSAKTPRTQSCAGRGSYAVVSGGGGRPASAPSASRSRCEISGAGPAAGVTTGGGGSAPASAASGSACEGSGAGPALEAEGSGSGASLLPFSPPAEGTISDPSGFRFSASGTEPYRTTISLQARLDRTLGSRNRCFGGLMRSSSDRPPHVPRGHGCSAPRCAAPSSGTAMSSWPVRAVGREAGHAIERR